jgi:hypothetical protein
VHGAKLFGISEGDCHTSAKNVTLYGDVPGDLSRIVLSNQEDVAMSERYLSQRAEDCITLAREEDDAELRAMLFDLAHVYREMARHVMAPYRAH